MSAQCEVTAKEAAGQPVLLDQGTPFTVGQVDEGMVVLSNRAGRAPRTTRSPSC